jgi:hypothetical protein
MTMLNQTAAPVISAPNTVLAAGFLPKHMKTIVRGGFPVTIMDGPMPGQPLMCSTILLFGPGPATTMLHPMLNPVFPLVTLGPGLFPAPTQTTVLVMR